MNNKETGGPAFPCRLDYNNPGAGKKDFSSPGMTLRDHFAGLAMQGLIASNATYGGAPRIDLAAKDAYDYADAMLKARAQ